MFKKNYVVRLGDLLPSLLLKDSDPDHQIFESSKLRNLKNEAKDSHQEVTLTKRHFLFQFESLNSIYPSMNQFFIKQQDHYFPQEHQPPPRFGVPLKLLTRQLLQSSLKKPDFHQKMSLL